MAVVDWHLGKPALVRELLESSYNGRRRGLVQALSSLSPAQFSSYQRGADSQISAEIEFHLTADGKSESTADFVFFRIANRKAGSAFWLESAIRTIRNRANKEDLALLEDWAATSRTRAQLALKLRGKASPELIDMASELELKQDRLEALLIRKAANDPQSFVVDRAALQKVLPTNAALVELVRYRPFDPKTSKWAEDHYAAYVLRKTGVAEGVKLGRRKDIDEALSLLIYDLQNAKSDWQASAGKVSSIIDTKLGPLLKGIDQLFICPEGQFHQIPFDVLTSESSKKLYADQFRISYLTTARELLAKTEPGGTGPQAIVANPDFGAVPPGTRPYVELFGPRLGNQALAQIFPSIFAKGIVLEGPQATEQKVRSLIKPSLLVFATHGIVLPEEITTTPTKELIQGPAPFPGEVGMKDASARALLALAGANTGKSGTDDGILTALELRTLDLRGCVLVFPACETAKGTVRYFEALAGFREAAIVAGSHTQIYALWQVDNRATQEFITSFLQNTGSLSNQDVALAYAKARDIMRTKRTHPFYWAPFVLSGHVNPQSLEKEKK
jgi:CHAT domain-containing protein